MKKLVTVICILITILFNVAVVESDDKENIFSTTLEHITLVQAEDLVRKALFERVNKILEEATKEKVSIYSPTNFTKGLEHYRMAENDYKRGKKIDEIRKKINQAMEYFNKGLEVTKFSKGELKDVITARDEIIQRNFRVYAASEFDHAEKLFNEAVLKLEKFDTRGGLKKAEEAFKYYCNITLIAVEKGILKDAKGEVELMRKRLKEKGYDTKYLPWRALRPKPLPDRKPIELSYIERQLKQIEETIPQQRNKTFNIGNFINDIDSKIKTTLDLLYPGYPEIFIMDGFILDVIEYKSGRFNPENFQFEELSGTATTNFYSDEGISLTLKVEFEDVTLQFPEAKRRKLQLDFLSKQERARLTEVIGKRKLIIDFSEIERIEAEEERREEINRTVGGIREAGLSISEVVKSLPIYPHAIRGRAFYLPQSAQITPQININGFTIYIYALEITPEIAKARLGVKLPFVYDENKCKNAIFELEEVEITSYGKFYVEDPEFRFESLIIGDAGIIISGTGIVADFNTLRGYLPGQDQSWQGIILLGGETKSISEDIVSNTGYLKAHYLFRNAIVTRQGLKAKFNLTSPYSFISLQPYGYIIKLNNGSLEIENSQLQKGEFTNGEIILPEKAVCDKDFNPIIATYRKLDIEEDMDLWGEVSIGKEIYWGELSKGITKLKAYSASKIQGSYFYLSATYKPSFYPINHATREFNEQPIHPLSISQSIQSQNIQGVTIIKFDELTIHTPDTPGRESLIFTSLTVGWINVIARGVHGYFSNEKLSLPIRLGPTYQPYYKSGDKPFDTTLGYIEIAFIDSAVCESNFEGKVKLEGKIKNEFLLKEMGFTSTAHNVGGEIIMQGEGINIEHWGVKMVRRVDDEEASRVSSVGVLSGKTGQIILTAAGIKEERHFAKPFWVTWGELLANGNIGELYFDYNAAGQKFDGISFEPEAVALSEYKNKPDLHVGGIIHFPFFGGTYLNIHDMKYEITSAPYNGRLIELDPSVSEEDRKLNFKPTEYIIEREWGDKFGFLHFRIKYDEATQNGFVSDEGYPNENYITLSNFMDERLDAYLVLKNPTISVGFNEITTVGFKLDPLLLVNFVNFGYLNNSWGCACFTGEVLERFVTGGELAVGGEVIFIGGVEEYCRMKSFQSPAVSEWEFAGEMRLKVGRLSVSVELDAAMDLQVNRNEDFAIGNIEGEASTTIKGADITSNGRYGFGVGAELFYIDGSVDVRLLALEFGGGLYIGFNAPQEYASGLYIAKNEYHQEVLTHHLQPVQPDRKLYGVYVYGHKTLAAFNFGIASGSLKLWLGAGMLGSGGGSDVALAIIGGGYTEATAKVSLIEIISVKATLRAALNMSVGYPLELCGMIGAELCGCCCLDLLCLCGDITGKICIGTDGVRGELSSL